MIISINLRYGHSNIKETRKSSLGFIIISNSIKTLHEYRQTSQKPESTRLISRSQEDHLRTNQLQSRQQFAQRNGFANRIRESFVIRHPHFPTSLGGFIRRIVPIHVRDLADGLLNLPSEKVSLDGISAHFASTTAAALLLWLRGGLALKGSAVGGVFGIGLLAEDFLAVFLVEDLADCKTNRRIA